MIVLIIAGIILIIGVGIPDWQFSLFWNPKWNGYKWLPLHAPTARVAGLLCFLLAYLLERGANTASDLVLLGACAVVLFILLGISLMLGADKG